MEGGKMKTKGLCKQRTNGYEAQTYRYSAPSYWAVSGNSRKFVAKVNLGAGFAQTKIVYQRKAKAMESWKNANPGFVQTTHQRLRISKHIVILHRRIWPPLCSYLLVTFTVT